MKSQRPAKFYRSFGENSYLDIWARRQRQRNFCELSTDYMVLHARQEVIVVFYFCVSCFLLRLFPPFSSLFTHFLLLYFHPLYFLSFIFLAMFYFSVSQFLSSFICSSLFPLHPLSSIEFSSTLISVIYSFSNSTVSGCIKTQTIPGHSVSQFQLQKIRMFVQVCF